MPGAVQRLLAALGFLSRFPLAVEATPDLLARSLGYFPAAGFVLGAVALFPVWLGLWAAQPAVQGALYVALLAWFTRGGELRLSDVYSKYSCSSTRPSSSIMNAS